MGRRVSDAAADGSKTPVKVCVVGGGAGGMACAWALARDGSKRFQVTLLESGGVCGGVATTEQVGDGVSVNDGVQGGSTSYRNVLNIIKLLGFTEHWVDVKVSFGTQERQWTNHVLTEKIKKHQREIERFEGTLKTIGRYEFFYAFFSISRVMKWFRYSDEFTNDIVLPLTALFFGTGNQQANVSCAIFARVFNDPKLRLYDYDPIAFLGQAPKMFAFPKFADLYAKYAEEIRATGMGEVRTHCRVNKVMRGSREHVVHYSTGEHSNDSNEGVEQQMCCDYVVFACNSENTHHILNESNGVSWMEKWVFGNVKYYDDITVTHTDREYMMRHYDLKDERNDMYFVKTYEEDRSKIEMSFDLTHYQPFAKGVSDSHSSVYQTIFLNKDQDEPLWTIDEIDESKVLLRKWWRQFSHSVRHFVGAVPFWRFIQGKRNTYHVGSYTLVNTHEIATISGLAAAYQMGAEYPFEADELAALQFDMYLKLLHGASRRKEGKRKSKCQ